jgi:DNA-binding MarR family transcriptional regulator
MIMTIDASDASDSDSSTRQSKRKGGANIPSFVREAQVTTLINLAARLTNKAARIRMGALGAWPGQIPLILWLLEKDGLIQKELVEKSNMEQSTVAEHLDRMERDGFVRREQGKDDKRKYRFFLTDRARLASRELIRSLETGARSFTRGIPADDLAIFTRVIRQIIGNLDEFVQRSPTAAPKPAPFPLRGRKGAGRRKR